MALQAIKRIRSLPREITTKRGMQSEGMIEYLKEKKKEQDGVFYIPEGYGGYITRSVIAGGRIFPEDIVLIDLKEFGLKDK